MISRFYKTDDRLWWTMKFWPIPNTGHHYLPSLFSTIFITYFFSSLDLSQRANKVETTLFKVVCQQGTIHRKTWWGCSCAGCYLSAHCSDMLENTTLLDETCGVPCWSKIQRIVLSNSSLSARRIFVCLTIQNAPSEDSDQTARMLTWPMVSSLTFQLSSFFFSIFSEYSYVKTVF